MIWCICLNRRGFPLACDGERGRGEFVERVIRHLINQTANERETRKAGFLHNRRRIHPMARERRYAIARDSVLDNRIRKVAVAWHRWWLDRILAWL